MADLRKREEQAGGKIFSASTTLKPEEDYRL